MAQEFEVGGQQYRSGKINAFTQSHILRRMAPLVSAFTGEIDAIRADPIKAFEPMAQAFAQMSDQDVEYIQLAALTVTQRQQGDRWAPVYVQRGGLAFEDIGALELNMIVVEVLKENLGPFFAGLGRMGLGDLLASKA